MTSLVDDADLKEKLRQAHDLGISVFCSTAEAAHSGPSVYPAAWSEYTTAVSACNRHFAADHYTDSSAKYYLPGERISADPLSYEDSEGIVSGSSVATAMAAGVASLILSCRNWARIQKEYPISKGKYRREAITSMFDNHMTKENTGKSVVPSHVFNVAAALKYNNELPESSRNRLRRDRVDERQWTLWIKARFGPDGMFGPGEPFNAAEP
jgi:hypothetical protein